MLIKFGEMALKGRNRKLFVAQLKKNLRRAIGPGAELRMRAGAIAVLAPMERDELVARAREVIGISVVHPALIVDKSADAAAAVAVDLLRGGEAQTFAIRARRRQKDWKGQ